MLLDLLFFYQILDKIGLLLLILNRKAKIHVGIELICYWVYLRVSKFQFRGGQNKNFKNNIIFKKKKIQKSGGSLEPPEHYAVLSLQWVVDFELKI